MADQHPVAFEDCERIGGHCWKPVGYVLTTEPPQRPESCKHCGATRVGVQQASIQYTEVKKRDG